LPQETEHIGSGGARDVYELVGTPWAVKIQKQGSTRGYDDEGTMMKSYLFPNKTSPEK
jgi:hypothetical protein